MGIEVDGANQKLILDSDGDTYLEAATDDTIKVYIAGAHDATISANAINVLSGTTLTIDSGATITNSGTANGFSSADPSSADGDTLGTASAEWSDLYLADGGVIYLGNDQDVTLTHVADTGILLNSTRQLQFNDSSQYINAPSNAILDINATDEIELNATAVDLNGTLDVSGTTTLGGTLTVNAGAVFNEASADVDFRIESNNDANCFYLDAGDDEIWIGRSSGWSDAKLQVFSNHSTTNDLIEGFTIGAATTGTAANNVGTKMTWLGSYDGGGEVELGQLGYHNTNVTGVYGDFVIKCRPNASSAERFRVASNGDLTATDTSISSNSDSRLKENIADYTYDISKFKQFQAKTFDWKNPEEHNSKTGNRGFIAQEVAAIDDYWTDQIPIDSNKEDAKLIDADSDGNHMAKTLKLGKKDAMYISVIQQLITRIEALEDA